MKPALARRPGLSLVVQYAAPARGLPSRAQFRRWARAALAHDASATIRVVAEEEGRALNYRYRHRNHATNVLTFVSRDRAPFAGDLALCAPVVRREARAQKKPVLAHYAHLTIHGLLHLQGYDHESGAEAKIMEQREIQIMAKLGYADPYLRT